MANHGLISVIIPVYNGSISLHRTLDSLIPSLRAGVEVIAVNDASNDQTEQVLDAFSLQHSSLRFHIVTHVTNQGVHAARLSGVQQASGDWIGFLDADDLASPNQFQRMEEQGQIHQADIVICGSDRVSAELRLLEHKVSFPQTELICTDIFGGFCQWRFGTGAMWNKLYRTDLIRKALNREFLWRHDGIEDTLVNIGAFLSAKRVLLLADSLHQYVQNDSSLTQSASCAMGFVKIFRAYAMALSAYYVDGPEVWQRITELYQRQLCFPSYALPPGEALTTHQELLEEAVAVINEIYPMGLALLAACPPQPTFHPSFPSRSLAQLKRAFRLISQRASVRDR
jgi:glycosyltransferase involved in cell wall biosynthesis